MTDTIQEQPIAIGATDLRTIPMGLGTWQWGDSFVWGYGKGYSAPDVKAAFETALASGITFYDTAEMYGFPGHTSEKLLGEYAQSNRQKLILATKFLPLPWRFVKGQLISALRDSVKRLRVQQVDLYQIHWPSPPAPVERWADALADAVQRGLTRAVGVSNYSAEQMRRSHEVLAKRGVSLATNQVEYSLLERAPERNGLLAACQELNITLIAYSPLAKGLLTGKYTPENQPAGARARMFPVEYLGKIQPLLARMREIGTAHGGKSPAQVALNWTICKGALTIPGAKNVRQAQENLGALGWRLTGDEVATLEAEADKIG